MSSLILLIVVLIIAVIITITLAVVFAPQLANVLYFLFVTGATVFFEYVSLIASFVLILYPPFAPYVYLSNILGLLLLLMSFWLTCMNSGFPWLLGPAGTRPIFLVIWHLLIAAIIIGVSSVQYQQYLLGIVAAAFFGLFLGLYFATLPFPIIIKPCSFQYWFRGFRIFVVPSLFVLALHSFAVYVYKDRASILDIGFVTLNIYLLDAILIAFTLDRSLGKYRIANHFIFLIIFLVAALNNAVDLAVFTLLAWLLYFVIAFFLLLFSRVFGLFLGILSIVIVFGIYALLL